MTTVIKSLSKWQTLRATLNGSIGFVPTMGNLHQGHLELLRHSITACDQSVLSIFINPKQFNEQSDLDNYPRTVMEDLAKAQELGVDYVLLPTENDMYPDDFHYQVHETALSQLMEGAHRPGHFSGMLTVVLKLLLLVKPNKAYFGEKDYQQLLLIQGMTKAFFLETDIIGVPTVRENCGLAMSSRNSRLSANEKILASNLYRILAKAPSDQVAAAQLTALGFEVEYVSTHKNRRLVAAKLNKIRLIDNIALKESIAC